jgi:hypothetical protein
MRLAHTPSQTDVRLPLRLRWVLLGVALVLVVANLVPRARAAWQIYTVAPALAAYAQCMVGPTGPSLIQQDPAGFQELVRRRLVLSHAGNQPFARCRTSLQKLTDSARSDQAHDAAVQSFVDWGATEGVEFSLGDLEITTAGVASLHRRAWPFVRGNLSRLIKPGLGTYQAVHPTEQITPAQGLGLPTEQLLYRSVSGDAGRLVATWGSPTRSLRKESRDGGRTWRELASAPGDRPGRCYADGSQFSAELLRDRGNGTWVLRSFRQAFPVADSVVTTSERSPVVTACDAEHAVVLTRRQSELELWLCPFGRPCRSMPLPEIGPSQPLSAYPVDVVRVAGATVVSVSMRGLHRVASTRDDGATWTPLTLALEGRGKGPKPGEARLLAFGSLVMLYVPAASGKGPYPALLSRDAGASWQAPWREQRAAVSSGSGPQRTRRSL